MPHNPTTQFFTGWMPFLPPNQQRQSTKGTKSIQIKTRRQRQARQKMPSLSMHACTYVCSAQTDKQVTKNLWQPTGWQKAKGYISFLKQYNTMAEYYTGVKKAASIYYTPEVPVCWSSAQ